jgi:hypothetical protein
MPGGSSRVVAVGNACHNIRRIEGSWPGRRPLARFPFQP